MPTKYYVPDLQKYEFQKAVLDKDILTPPGNPAVGDRYLINGTGEGAWSGQDYNIATWDGSSWIFTIRREGMLVWVKDEDVFYAYDGSSWLVVIHEHANYELLNTYTQTEENLADAVAKKHVAGTDTMLDSGGPNQITAAQAKEAYTRRAVYNEALEVIEFDI